jgi:hypothetical protein
MSRSRHVTRAPSATDWIAPWMQMYEIAATAPLVIGYRTARMLTGGWPPSAGQRQQSARHPSCGFTRSSQHSRLRGCGDCVVFGGLRSVW